MAVNNRFLFPIFQPEVPGNPCVVFVGFAVALPPVIKFTGLQAQPPNEPSGADLGLLRPAPDEIDDLVPHVMRDPDAGQSSPKFFLARYAPPSTRPEPRLWSGSSSPDTRSAPVRPDGSVRLSARKRPRRSQRIPSAIDRRPSAADPVPRTSPIPPRSPPNVASEQRPFPLPCNASVASSRVLSVILTAQRFLHFQLRRDSFLSRLTSCR